LSAVATAGAAASAAVPWTRRAAIHALAGQIPGMNPLHIALVPGAPRVPIPA